MTNHFQIINRYFIPLLASVVISISFAAQADEYSLNLDSMDLIQLIEEVGEITGRTFIFDESRVRGEVTVITQKPLPVEGIFALFETIMRARGFTIIDDGEISTIVPSTEARYLSRTDQEALELNQAFIAQVVHLENIESSEATRVLRQLVSNYGHLVPIVNPNALIIADHAKHVRSIIGLLNELDKPSIQQSLIISLEHALVSDIAASLEQILPNIRNTIRGGETQNYRITAFANENNNTLFVRGTDEQLALVVDTVDKLDQPYTVSNNTRIFYLQHAESKNVQTILDSLLSSGGGIAGGVGSETGQGSRDYSIQEDETNNAILVRANPSLMVEIQNIIEQIDVPRMQVLIEAAIVEVTVEDKRTIGTELAGTDGSEDSVPLVSTSVQGLLSGLLTSIVGETVEPDRDTSLGPTASLLGGSDNPTLAIAKLDPEGVSFGAIISAIETNSNSNLLSTPHVISLDNVASRIFVGQEVPIRTGSITSTPQSGPEPIQTVERIDVGVSLDVTPKIRPDKSVLLIVASENGAVVAPTLGIGDTGFSDVVTNKREVRTTIVAKDRQTIVLGGLITDGVNRTMRKVPFLGSIPLLGRVFRSQSTTQTKTHLLIFLRPTVLENEEEMQAVFDRKMGKIWQLQLDRDTGGVDEETPPTDAFYDGRP